MAEDFFGNVKPGARVHYLDRHGKTASGTVVINKGTHLVLNTGGRHGTPKVVTPDNYVKHSEGGKVKGALLSNLAKSMKKEETQLDELKTSTLKSYGRKAIADLPKQVKRARTSWDKHVATNMNPDPDKAWDVMVDAEHKLKVRKAGIKRLAAKLVDRGETSVNEEGEQLDAYKSALAYETKKKIKKKKHTKETKKAVKEAYNARETEHSGAKKGKGAYYGRKQDAKKESNKARREADKKQCCEADLKVGPAAAQKLDNFATKLHDDPVRIRRVKAIARLKAIKKVHKAEQDEKSKHGGWTGMKEAHYRDNPSIKFLVHKLDKGALVMTDRGDVHDHYDSHEEARKAADKLNNDYGVRRWNKKRAEKEAVKEERIDEIGPFNISKHPAGAKALKIVDKVLDKIQDRADARYQKKQDKIAKDRYGKSWTEAGMKAPRKIDPMHQRYPDGSGPEKNESTDCNFYNRLDEVSRELLTRYVRRAARSAAAAGEQGGVAWGREAMRTKDLDAAEKAERPHINKARKRIRGIDKAVSKIGKDPLNAAVYATNEGRESEYRANMQLAGTARRKPGHYLVRNGSTLSGPHEPHDALRKYKDMNDTSGVKIVHIKEAKSDKAKEVTQKALLSAKNKKGKTANIEPEMETPSASTSQPMLQGPEGADNARV